MSSPKASWTAEIKDRYGFVRASVHRESTRRGCPIFVEVQSYLSNQEARGLALALQSAVMRDEKYQAATDAQADR